MAHPSILIVESDITVRQPLAEYLRECGYNVFEAVNAEEAVAILRDGARTIGVVLADVGATGDIDGFGLARWIRSNTAETRVILAGTVSKTAKSAGDLCEHGPILKKPYDHQILLDRIKSLAAQRDRNSDG